MCPYKLYDITYTVMASKLERQLFQKIVPTWRFRSNLATWNAKRFWQISKFHFFYFFIKKLVILHCFWTFTFKSFITSDTSPTSITSFCSSSSCPTLDTSPFACDAASTTSSSLIGISLKKLDKLLIKTVWKTFQKAGKFLNFLIYRILVSTIIFFFDVKWFKQCFVPAGDDNTLINTIYNWKQL